jgi:hypothetical protein
LALSPQKIFEEAIEFYKNKEKEWIF